MRPGDLGLVGLLSTLCLLGCGDDLKRPGDAAVGRDAGLDAARLDARVVLDGAPLDAEVVAIDASTSPQLVPASHDFGRIAVGGAETSATFTLHSGSAAALDALAVTTTGAPFSVVASCPATLAPGASCTMVASFDVTGAAGMFTGSLEVRASGSVILSAALRAERYTGVGHLVVVERTCPAQGIVRSTPQGGFNCDARRCEGFVNASSITFTGSPVAGAHPVRWETTACRHADSDEGPCTLTPGPAGTVRITADFCDPAPTGPGVDIAVDASGSSFVAGENGLWLGKYDGSLSLQWARQTRPRLYLLNPPAVDSAQATSVTLDPAGRPVVTGSRSTDDGRNGILREYDAQGLPVWRLSLATSEIRPSALATDAAGALLWTARLPSDVIHVGRVNGAGLAVWQRDVTPTGGGETAALGVDGTSALVALGSGRIHMVDSAGVTGLQVQTGASVLGVAVAADHSIILAGVSSGNVPFLRKLDGAGVELWTRTPTFSVADVVVAASGTIHVAGTVTGGGMALVQSWDAAGNPGAIMAGPAGTAARALALGPSGVRHVTGSQPSGMVWVAKFPP